MTAMIKTTCVLALLCSSLSAQNDEVQRGLKILPVADLLRGSSSPRPPRLTDLSNRADRQDRNPALLATGRYRVLGRGELEELVLSSMRGDDDEISASLQAANLFLEGPEEGLAEAEELVNALRGAVARRTEIRARLFRVETDTPYPAMASAADLRPLVADLSTIWEGVTTALSGQQVSLALTKLTRYVNEVQTEVAQDSSIYDPETGTMFEGIDLVVESHSMIASGDRALYCQFALAERNRGIQLLSTGVRNMMSIGIPDLSTTSGSFSGRVQNGGALLVSIQSRAGEGSNLLLVLQVRDLDQGQAMAPVGKTLLLPVSAITSKSLRDRPAPVPADGVAYTNGRYPALSDGFGFPEMDAGPSIEGGHLVELISQSLGELADEEDSYLTEISNGLAAGYLIVQGSEALHAGARRVLGSLEDRMVQSVQVQVRSRLPEISPSTSIFSQVGASSAGEGPTQKVVTFPTMLDHSSLVFSGTETAVVQDYDVEIAQEKSSVNPVVFTVFKGLSVTVSPAMHGEDLGAEVDVAVSYFPEPTLQRMGWEEGGDLFHLQLQRAEFHQDGPVQAGTHAFLGWGPRIQDGGVTRQSNLTVRIDR